MQQGGGIWLNDFSHCLRAGAALPGAPGVGGRAVGAAQLHWTFWDAMCRTVMSAGARRGANGCDPCAATTRTFRGLRRRQAGAGAVAQLQPWSVLGEPNRSWRRFEAGADCDLVFGGEVHRTVSCARDCGHRIIARHLRLFAEPGVIFIDRINQRNNLQYARRFQATQFRCLTAGQLDPPRPRVRGCCGTDRPAVHRVVDGRPYAPAARYGFFEDRPAPGGLAADDARKCHVSCGLTGDHPVIGRSTNG